MCSFSRVIVSLCFCFPESRLSLERGRLRGHGRVSPKKGKNGASSHCGPGAPRPLDLSRPRGAGRRPPVRDSPASGLGKERVLPDSE
jgi:hypothetical protein